MMTFEPSTEQISIIEHADRALRISAGAGTGKTTTIVHRLAHAVSDGADPARALGVTFTNKAADELRERLRTAVPARADGREIEVATYHGFAAAILDEFGAWHGHVAGSGIMDEGHRFELAARVLRSLDRTDLDLTKIPSLRKDVLAVADALNENLIDADDVRALAPSALDDVWRIRLALIDAAERYRTAKAHLGMLEYSDLIRRATAIVEADPDIATTIRDRYDIVLLDEYQDTDRAQRRMLTGVFRGGPAVTAVGDTNQTIYEWRGASFRNFEAFPADFPLPDGSPAPTLPLSINRRSDRRIIELANRVRSELPTTGGSEELRASNAAGDGDIVASWHRTDAEEAEWIAEQISTRHEADNVPFSEMAVLCRRRDSLRVLAETLRAADVPFTVSSMSDLLDVPEMADLHAWLRVLAHPDDERALLRILLGGRYRLGLGDVAVLQRAVPAGSTLGLMEVILEPDHSANLGPSASDAVAAFAVVFRSLHSDSQASSASSTLGAVIEALDLWAEVAALPPAASTTARLNLSRYIDLIDHWRPLSGRADLASFLRYIDALAEPGRAEELDAAEPPSEDAVLLTTVHGAKGLEWSDVYLADVAHGVFPSGVRDYHEPLSKPAALPYEVRLDADDFADVAALTDAKTRKELLKARHVDQEWRLAYVAVTRAKHRISVSGHMWHGDNTTPRAPGALLELAMASGGASLGPVVDGDVPKPTPTTVTVPSVAPDPLFPDGWGAAIRATIEDPAWPTSFDPDIADAVEAERRQLEMQLEGLAEPATHRHHAPFVTSVTNLVALAECPLKFRWIHHDRLPRKPRASARRGTDFHRRAELFNLGVLSLADSVDATYDTSDDRDGGGPRSGVDPWDVFTQSRFAHETPAFVETPFVITLDGRSVRGKVDAIYDHGDRWEIVDYKSGVATPSDAKRVQLEAYATAAAAGAFGVEAPSALEVTFAWFGENPPIEQTETAGPAWLDRARGHVAGLLSTAESGPFDPSPSPECRWCDFLHHCDAGREFLSTVDS